MPLAVTGEQLEILLNTAHSLRDRCIISLLFDSGLRLSELCRIKPDDIDWDAGTLGVIAKAIESLTEARYGILLSLRIPQS